MTSTLQQEAGRKLRYTAQRTMQIAQRLYENGYITYMRTDSTTLSDTALAAARRQMADARGKSVQVRLGGPSSTGEDAEFAASGKVIEFPGFLRAYVEGSDDPEAELEDREIHLPAMAEADPLGCQNLDPKGHTTQPPARYTEASLVKALEEMGVGRPSTYASIIGTIQDRGYVFKKGSALVPS